MLSNVKLKIDDPTFPELVFSFEGMSMCDLTNISSAENSIFPNDRKGGTDLFCEKASCLEKVIREIDIDGNYFVVVPFFDGPFVCCIKERTVTAILFNFINPDKAQFPNQYLRIDEVKSIHLVKRIVYDDRPSSWCECASEGDYCGDRCYQPQNAPENRKEQPQ